MEVANTINNSIDNVVDASITMVEKVAIDKALMAILGVTTGPWSLILTPLIKLILRKSGVWQLVLGVKRKGELLIDICEGKYVLRKMEKALSEGNIDEVITIYADDY